MKFEHIPVMLEECINGLNIKMDGIYVDGTLGGAGHSSEIIKRLSPDGLLIGIDRDDDALKAASEKLKEYSNKKLVHGNHDDIKEILAELEIEKVDGILLDLGVSSYQLDERNRGFSYNSDNELDMRMDQTQPFSAYDVINTYSEKELSDIIYKYGEERYSRQIARNIVNYRKDAPIKTTKQLVDIIAKSKPAGKDGHPAKRTFQAIRIEVNNEIEPLEKTILESIKCLKNNGRLCVITFHSLEDRAVKDAFKKAEGECTCPKDIPICVCHPICYGKSLTKKPIIATDDELKINSRSKSAKLRIFERKEVYLLKWLITMNMRPARKKSNLVKLGLLKSQKIVIKQRKK